MEFANGVNRPVIHTSVHQPLDKGPGFSLAIFGQYFNRLDSWAEMAGPWVDYMSRSSFLLQQGRNVADLAYFIGEEQPAGVLFAKNALGDLPRSYAYDLFDAGMLTGALSVQGRISLPRRRAVSRAVSWRNERADDRTGAASIGGPRVRRRDW